MSDLGRDGVGGQPQPAASTERTPYHTALELHRAGVPRERIAEQLNALGLDEESVRVVLHTLPGAPQPTTLPELHFALTTNPLAPSMVSVLDLGLEGERRTVALYWLAFGGIFAALVTLAMLVAGFDVLDTSSSAWAEFAVRALPWVGYPLAVATLSRGVWLLASRPPDPVV